MRIAAVRHALPSCKITNDWVVSRVAQASAGHMSPSELSQLELRLRRLLAAAGTEVRYALTENERAVDLIRDAGRAALREAGVEPSDVDLVIYSSVARGWIEPATAPLVQAELSLVNASAFDIMEACAGWLRSLQVAHNYLRSGSARCALLVNCECGLYQGHADWQFRSVEELDHRFAQFTIGEATTATVVTNGISREDDFYFSFRTLGEGLDLCMIPLPLADRFVGKKLDPRLVPLRFFALSAELLGRAQESLAELFRSDPMLRDRPYDISFGHEASRKVSEAVARSLGVNTVYFPTHSTYGNTVSASVPLAMSLAIEQGRLKRGDRVLVIVGSAGMTIGFVAFTF